MLVVRQCWKTEYFKSTEVALYFICTFMCRGGEAFKLLGGTLVLAVPGAVSLSDAGLCTVGASPLHISAFRLAGGGKAELAGLP